MSKVLGVGVITTKQLARDIGRILGIRGLRISNAHLLDWVMTHLDIALSDDTDPNARRQLAETLDMLGTFGLSSTEILGMDDLVSDFVAEEVEGSVGSISFNVEYSYEPLEATVLLVTATAIEFIDTTNMEHGDSYPTLQRIEK